MELGEEAQRALGMHTPLSDVLSGKDKSFERFIQANADVFTLPQKQEPLVPAKPEQKTEQQRELITLKPTIYGIGIDLKEAWRRFQCWRKQQ